MKTQVKRILASSMAAVSLIGAGAAAIATRGFGLFEKDSYIQAQLPEEPETPGGEVVLHPDEGQGIKLMSKKLAKTEYAANGVSAQAETAYTLTATITPADAENKLVDWSVAWKNSASAWATGKTVTDYVTITPTADGALTANAECKQAFGEQIVISVTSRQNTAAKATCTVEYEQRVTGYSLSLGDMRYDSTGTITNTVKPTFETTQNATVFATVNKTNVFTKVNAASISSLDIAPTEAFKTAITNAGLDSTKLKTYSSISSGNLTNFFDSEWGEALYGTDLAKKNLLINTLKDYTGNAYEITFRVSPNAPTPSTFYITLDTSAIIEQKAVEGITIDQSEIVF